MNCSHTCLVLSDWHVCRWTIATQCRHPTTNSRSYVCVRFVQHSLVSTTTTVVLPTTLVASCTLASSRWGPSLLSCRLVLTRHDLTLLQQEREPWQHILWTVCLQFSNLFLVSCVTLHTHLCICVCILCFFHTAYMSYHCNTVGRTWSDWSLVLRILSSFSALTLCWLGLLTCKNLPTIWPVVCLVRR